jgi:hypothetical protein
LKGIAQTVGSIFVVTVKILWLANNNKKVLGEIRIEALQVKRSLRTFGGMMAHDGHGSGSLLAAAIALKWLLGFANIL